MPEVRRCLAALGCLLGFLSLVLNAVLLRRVGEGRAVAWTDGSVRADAPTFLENAPPPPRTSGGQAGPGPGQGPGPGGRGLHAKPPPPGAGAGNAAQEDLRGGGRGRYSYMVPNIRWGAGSPAVDLGVGASDVSRAGRDVELRDWEEALSVARARHRARVAAAAASGEEFRTAPSLKELAGPQRLVTDAQNRTTVSHVIELMRIPKGASTHLSIAGRALAGCPHPGYPCCIKKHDGEYCPRENLYCALVKKCVGHGGLHEPDDPIPTITQFRDPAERLLSGFFYPEGTHNKHHKDCSTWECFEKYLADPRLRDAPATKMLLGRYPYSPDRIKPGEVEHAKLNLCKLAWFGMIDAPLASRLLLYEMDPFDRIEPHPVLFELPPDDGGVIEPRHVRRNSNSTYKAFAEGEYRERGGLELVVSLNEYEFELYGFAWGLFCGECQWAID